MLGCVGHRASADSGSAPRLGRGRSGVHPKGQAGGARQPARGGQCLRKPHET
ncbi:hypothetical protein D516_2588 [Rhodobacter sp. AKP1]|nr:hypothetical protein D516_2588 [Rhodobacter sp. AKP1]